MAEGNNNNGNGWPEYKKYVISELESASEKIGQIFAKIDHIRAECLPEMHRQIDKTISDAKAECVSEIIKVERKLTAATAEVDRKLTAEIAEVKREVAVMQGKAALLGVLGGLVVSFVLELVLYFLTKR